MSFSVVFVGGFRRWFLSAVFVGAKRQRRLDGLPYVRKRKKTENNAEAVTHPYLTPSDIGKLFDIGKLSAIGHYKAV